MHLGRADGLAIGAATMVLASALAPLLVVAREEGRSVACEDRLRAIAEGALGFARAHGDTLPSNRRQPFTSWNTLVLPYMDQQELFDQCDLGADWWSPPNRTIGAVSLPALVCPAAPRGDRRVPLLDPEGHAFEAAATDYVASAGAYLYRNKPEQLFRGAMASPGRHYGGSHVTAGLAVRLAEISDGVSNTCLVVEMADKPRRWHAGRLPDQGDDSDPRPLVEGFSFGQWIAPNWSHLRAHTLDGREAFGPCAVNCSNAGAIYSFHSGYANVAFADGHVAAVRAGLDEEVLIALVSIADGELLAPVDYATQPPKSDNEPGNEP